MSAAAAWKDDDFDSQHPTFNEDPMDPIFLLLEEKFYEPLKEGGVPPERWPTKEHLVALLISWRDKTQHEKWMANYIKLEKVEEEG